MTSEVTGPAQGVRLPPEIQIGSARIRAFAEKPTVSSKSPQISSTGPIETSKLEPPGVAAGGWRCANLLAAKGIRIGMHRGSKAFPLNMGGHEICIAQERENQRLAQVNTLGQTTGIDQAIAALGGSDRGGAPIDRKRLECRQEYKGIHVGTDIADPQSTRTPMIRSVQHRIKTLQGTTDPSKLEELELCQKILDQLLTEKGEFRASNYATEAVRGEIKPGNLQSAELVNCYVEQFQDAQKNKVGSFTRFGAITDRGEGLLNLKMLKELQADPKKVQEVKDEIIQLREKQEKKHHLSDAQKETFSKALDDLDHVESTLMRRRILLQQQALQLMNIQVKEHGAELKQGEPLHMFQLSLLHPGVRRVEKSGLAHCEDNEMLDEAEILKEISNQDLILEKGLEAPYIDAAGKFHLQKPPGMESNSVKVVVHFANAVVQRKIKGDKPLDLYKEINEGCLQEMDTLLQAKVNSGDWKAAIMRTKLQKCHAAINAGTVSYYVADDLVAIGRFLGWNLSINCHSGKDRTGFISFRAMHRMALECVDKKVKAGELTEAQGRNAKSVLGEGVLDENSIPRQITEVNGGWHFMKIFGLHFPGLERIDRKIHSLWNMARSALEQKGKKTKE